MEQGNPCQVHPEEAVAPPEENGRGMTGHLCRPPDNSLPNDIRVAVASPEVVAASLAGEAIKGTCQ